MKIHLLLLSCIYCCYAAPLDNGVSINKDDTGVDSTGLSYLMNKGYYVPKYSSEIGQIQATQEQIASALKDFQKMAYIPVTGKFDAATKEMMKKARCGMSDVQHNKNRKKRFNPQGSVWQNVKLTWALENSNNDGIRKDEVRNIMQRSFAKWEAISNLEFTEKTGLPIDSTDIRVRFERGNHGDPYPFDGSGGTLAHAFFPLNNRGLSGDVHFDDDEVYTVKSNDGRGKRKLLWVAVHELGHSIGLDHSTIRGAVMYPWYQDFEGDDFDLTEDDRLGVQSLYGSREIPTKKTPPTTKSTLSPAITPKKSKCTNFVGAALYGKDRYTYIFDKNLYYRLRKEEDGMGVEQGPLLVKSLFKEIDTVDAIFRRRHDKAIVIFHGDKFTVYDGITRKVAARKISDGFHGLPTGFSDVDAAFQWSENTKLYIFKGEQYWRFSKQFNSDDFILDRNYPKRISTGWEGLPKSVDAVFEWMNGQTYFFKDDVYYRWDKIRREVRFGYPQKISNTFLECTKGSFKMQRQQQSSPSNSIVSVPSFIALVSLFILSSYFTS